jgi:radical SAM-linked protein
MEAVQQPNHPVQRLRLTLSKEEAIRYISHLDLARALERALIRAGLPVAYSQGFNRRPRLSMAAALPLGYTSEAEMADVWLIEPVEPELFRARLAASMPPGMAVKSVAEAPLSAPSLQQLMVESTYRVSFLDPVNEAELRGRVEAMLAATSFPLERRRSKDSRPKAFDLRPLILAMRLIEESGAPQLSLRLVQTATQSGRPDDVLSALGLDPLAAKVHRASLKLAESAG